MKVISTYMHGVLDYVVGFALILAPTLFGFAYLGGPAVTIPRILGIAVVLMALMTRYELGVMKVIPMGAHLSIDYVAGLFLAASPWIFGFADAPANAWVPHVAVGLGVLLVTAMTQRMPGTVARRTI
jgi:hypothetical protein